MCTVQPKLKIFLLCDDVIRLFYSIVVFIFQKFLGVCDETIIKKLCGLFFFWIFLRNFSSEFFFWIFLLIFFFWFILSIFFSDFFFDFFSDFFFWFFGKIFTFMHFLFLYSQLLYNYNYIIIQSSSPQVLSSNYTVHFAGSTFV